VYESFAAASGSSSDGSSNDGKQLQQLALRYSLPSELVEKVGAPPAMWTIIRCVCDSWHRCCYVSVAHSSFCDSCTCLSRACCCWLAAGIRQLCAQISCLLAQLLRPITPIMTLPLCVCITTCSCPDSSPISSSSSHAAPGDLEVSVVWQGKRPTRLPEALWLSFQPGPAAVDQASWRLHKLDSLISPMEVSTHGC
jgi:hypothetical protein